MKFKVQSQLMKNQRHASILNSKQDFDVVHTSDGHAVLFTLYDPGTGNKTLKAYREVSGHKTAANPADIAPHGWQPLDLTPKESSSVVAFAVAQNPHTHNYDVVVAVIENGAQTVRISQNNKADAFETLAQNGLVWDDPYTPPEPVTIKTVFILNMQKDDQAVQMIYADTLKNPNSNLLRRYWINPAKLNTNSNVQTHWFERDLGEDFAAGKTTSLVGRPASPPYNERYSGIYTYGKLGQSIQLNYQPSRQFMDPSASPNPTILQSVPAGASAIAVSPVQPTSPHTNLWAMAPDQLYLYGAKSQHDYSIPVAVGPKPTGSMSDIFKGVNKMVARIRNGKTVLWCLNEKGLLFYLSCPLGQEENITKWTLPIPIQKDIANFAFYVAENPFSQSLISPNVVFAETVNGDMMTLTQNPSTSAWANNHVLLQDPDVKAMYEQPSFTTRAVITDDHGAPLPQKKVTVMAKVKAICYINSVYYNLSAGESVTVATGYDGSLTIVQKTIALNASAMVLTAPDGTAKTVDPLKNAYQKLDTVTTVHDLKYSYKDEYGKPQETASGSSDTVLQSAVDNLKHLSSARTDLQKEDKQQSNGNPPPNDNQTTEGFALDVSAEGFFDDAFSFVGDLAQAVASGIVDLADDIAKGVEHAAEVVKDLATSAWKFVVKIAGSAINLVVDTVEAVGSAVMVVFNTIKMAIEKLIAFLGFLFEWQDFKRTHMVLGHLMQEYLDYALESVDRIEHLAVDCVDLARNEIDKLLSDDVEKLDSKSFASTSATHPIPDSADQPQTPWASHHTSNHVQDVQLQDKDSEASINYGDEDSITKALSKLRSIMGDEVNDVLEALKDFVKKIKDDISTVSPLKLLKDAVKICVDLAFKTAENMIAFILTLVKVFLEAAIESLTAKLSIPIISTLYEEFVGSPLTFLDLGALVGAIPITIMYKLATGESPFPDEGTDQFKRMTTFKHKKMATSISKSPSSSPVAQENSFAVESVADQNGNNDNDRQAIEHAKEAGEFIVGLVRKDIELLTTISCFAAFAGGALITGITTVRSLKPDFQWSKKACCAVFACYIGYISPNIIGGFQDSGNWANIFNDVVTGLATFKFVIDWFPGTQLKIMGPWNDYVSCWVDTVLNILWLVPAYATEWSILNASNAKPSDAVALDANFFFDIGGIAAPLAAEYYMEEFAPLGIAFVGGCNGIYSAYMAIAGNLRCNNL